MIVTDLCRAWPGAAAHMEVCRSTHPSSTKSTTPPSTWPPPPESMNEEKHNSLNFVEREETLLVLLADGVEADARTQDALLRRWGVGSAWDYTRALCGRCWWTEAGYVAVLPTNAAAVVDDLLRRELARLWFDESKDVPALTPLCTLGAVLDAALASATLEKALTNRLESLFSTQLVPQGLYEGAFHKAVVAVPPTVALFLSRLSPRLLHDCVVFHCHDRPLFPFGRHFSDVKTTKFRSTGSDGGADDDDDHAEPVVMPSACPDLFLPLSRERQRSSCSSSSAKKLRERYDVAVEESQRLADLLHEYDLLLSNKGAVRVPLPPMSRYVFTLLLCQCELPSTLMAPFIHRHAAVVASQGCVCEEEEKRNGSDSRGTASNHRVSFTEEEIVLGIKASWALQRWTAALRTRPPSRGVVAPPSSLPSLWEDGVRMHSEGYLAWVRDQMQSAQQEAKELFIWNGETDTALNDTRRGSTFCTLEQNLFAPLPVTFRGTSTEWILSAVREVGEQYAQVPRSLLSAAEMELDDEHQPNPRESSMVVLPTTMSSCPNGARLDSETSDDPTDDYDAVQESSNNSVAASDGKSEEEEEEAATLLAHMNELEAALQAELGNASPPFHSRPHSAEGQHTDGVKTPGVASAWLSKEDMANVSRNELFLNHVQLFGEEMANENSV
ncbi:hypothetical protein ABB37_02937 [Leptomonas pyrrhocoris]|uniref:Uncharacterized protein n=1 Tax=Leptomonas pyrrhocoris TaxID=157538 RepID=A0A0M9G633_LEPPY|nr:hypothetical protein ABB37_02937 [Leptomonas pyrrhocoris]KPA83260.1 hypothetical protein ABB37_02937 [Leptomonas pyrrhocoris]|eukprot:XP_015661699.1 hypothetical protein ABB37_02937 [Leptomonas pyrrhocoris]